MGAAAWTLTTVVLISGFAGVVALTRAGMRLFWTATARTTPRLRLLEAAPVAFLVAVCIVLGTAASPIMQYLEHAAVSLHEPQDYIRDVLAPAASDTRGAP